MTKLLRTLTVLLFLVTVLAASPAAAQTCDYLVTCFDNLPEHQTPHPAWQYSHQCCDLNDHKVRLHRLRRPLAPGADAGPGHRSVAGTQLGVWRPAVGIR